MTNKNKGFTLIELLIVIGIIAILATAIIIAVNPGQRLQEARDATYKAHQQAIGTAVHMAVLDGEYASVVDWFSGSDCSSGGTVAGDCTAALGLGETPVPPGGGLYKITQAAPDNQRVTVECDTAQTGCEARTF